MRKSEDVISVDFRADTTKTIRRYSTYLGMSDTATVQKLVEDGLRDEKAIKAVKDTLEHLKDVYNRNSNMSHEEFLRLMGEAKQIPIDCVENSVKRNEIVQKAFAFNDESSAYMQRMTVIDEITAELKAKGVFA